VCPATSKRLPTTSPRTALFRQTHAPSASHPNEANRPSTSALSDSTELGPDARLASAGQYVILFRIRHDIVRIERVVHGSRACSRFGRNRELGKSRDTYQTSSSKSDTPYQLEIRPIRRNQPRPMRPRRQRNQHIRNADRAAFLAQAVVGLYPG